MATDDKPMSGDETVVFSASALKSMRAAMTEPSREPTADEKARDAVRSAVLCGEHVQAPPTEEFVRHGGTRLYAVTTIASSERFGGKRTVTVCSTFARAKEIVETNEADIAEMAYFFAVIEAIAADWLYYYLDEQYWYVWDGSWKDGRYRPIEKPEMFAGLTNIGDVG